MVTLATFLFISIKTPTSTLLGVSEGRRPPIQPVLHKSISLCLEVQINYQGFQPLFTPQIPPTPENKTGKGVRIELMIFTKLYEPWLSFKSSSRASGAWWEMS